MQNKYKVKDIHQPTKSKPSLEKSAGTKMSFRNYLLSDWVTIRSTSKWIFGHLQSCENNKIIQLLEDIIILYQCPIGIIMGGESPDLMGRELIVNR